MHSSIQRQRQSRWFHLPSFASLKLAVFIAYRYLRSKHSLNVISVMTGLSIAGITVGVAALIIVMSLFNGFQSLIDRFLIGFDPHLRISSVQTKTGGQWIRNVDTLQAYITSALKPFGVVSLSPRVRGTIVCINKRLMRPFTLLGIEEASTGSASGIRKTLAVGEFRVQALGSYVALVLGSSLADHLRVVVGDTVELLPLRSIEAAITQAVQPRTVRAIVTGIFQSNAKEYDATQGYTALETARRLLGIPDGAIQEIDIRLSDVQYSEPAKTHLQLMVSGGLRVETWFDLHRDLYNVMRFERLAAFCVLSLIVLVAVLNMFASLSMMVTEKRAEIGMIKALGAPSGLIVGMFQIHSILIGCVGVVVGTLMGVGLCWGQMNFGWIELDATRYVVPILPLIVDWRDVLIICAIGLMLAMIAGIAPARQAGTTRSVVEMLRKERV
ncbi:MAG: ABC transporter permease [Bacteroidota bacterium]|nr:ABC transporter permease [Candidatus Kapabacteria bacterium]MDW8220481.1 ABC transporter permease [Bacteroidota bacterium]